MRILNLSPRDLVEACPAAHNLDDLSVASLNALGKVLTSSDVFCEDKDKFSLYLGGPSLRIPTIFKDVFIPLGIENLDCEDIVEAIIGIDFNAEGKTNKKIAAIGLNTLISMLNCFIVYSIPHIPNAKITANSKINIISDNYLLSEVVLLTDSDTVQDAYSKYSFTDEFNMKFFIPQFIGYYMDNRDV